MKIYTKACASAERIVESAVDLWYEAPSERFSIGCPQEILGIRCGICSGDHFLDVSCDDRLREKALKRLDLILLAKIERVNRAGGMRFTGSEQEICARVNVGLYVRAG